MKTALGLAVSFAALVLTGCDTGEGAVTDTTSPVPSTAAATVPTAAESGEPWSRDTRLAMQDCIGWLRLVINDQPSPTTPLLDDAREACGKASDQANVDMEIAEAAKTPEITAFLLTLGVLNLALLAALAGQEPFDSFGTAEDVIAGWESLS